MPSTRPCAAFEPISPDFDLNALVASTPNFEWVARIPCEMIQTLGLESFEKLVLIHVILGGKPLVIEGYQEKLDKWIFAPQWLRDNVASKVETARDLTKKTNVPLSIGHYLNNMAVLTDQWTNKNYKDVERQRIYLKDIDCPQLWHEKVRDTAPLGSFYLNDTTGEVDGLGAVDELDPAGPGMCKGRGVAKAGDLMSSLPKEMRAENLMCYIGHEGTYTPAHREMCASLGQNIMVETSTGAVEDGKPTKPGSSLWFMTETKEREVVSEYWLSKLGHDIEVENHFAQINAWKAAPFKTYVVDQRVGDFILIPPLAPHQVWNRGTRTMKVAWNRITVETLEMALHEALPRARMVCRDEQYKNKAIIYYTLDRYSKNLKVAEQAKKKQQGSKSKELNDVKIRQVQKDFRRLQRLFTEILISESYFPHQNEKKIQLIPFDSNITCSYCRCNIFNRFLTCPSCVGELSDGGEDTYDICMDCYAMGRSCACISKLKWVEQFPWNELVQNHEKWRHQILQTEGKATAKSPRSLRTELERMGQRRTLAQICQLELARRPFRDISKSTLGSGSPDTEGDVEVDVNGNVKNRKKRKSEKFNREHGRCHVDSHWEPKWKQAECSGCDKIYCYGVLFRAYDMMPQDILADPNWKCPSCQNICSCRHCRKKPGYKPFTPAGTILGHNTKAIADPRSVESLVDFSFSNIQWIQKAGDDHEGDTRRLQKRQRAAVESKNRAPDLSDNYAGEDTSEMDDVEEDSVLLTQQEGSIPIDPALVSMGTPSSGSPHSGDSIDENPEEASKNAQYIGTASMSLRHVMPDGGVIRSFENAYQTTDAITYDYPDPGAAETGQGINQVAQASEMAMSSGRDQIEMVNRKRRREKVDEGDKPYGYKIKKLASEKSRPKKSLIGNLNLDKEDLINMSTMAINAQKVLGGVSDAPAAVINSNLKALNAEGNESEGLTLPKNSSVEQTRMDIEDAFTPSRYWDKRRRATNEAARPPPDAEVTRREKRVQAASNDDPSDNEKFTKSLSDRPSGSKLTVIECVGDETKALDCDGMDVEQNEERDSVAGVKSDSRTDETTNSNFTFDFDDTFDLVMSQPAPKPHFSSSSQPGETSMDGQTTSNGSQKRAITSKSTTGQHISRLASKAVTETEDNRKTKLAVLEWADADSHRCNTDDWSMDEARSSSTEKQAAPPPPHPQSQLQRHQTPTQAIQSAEKRQNKPIIQRVKRTLAQKQATAPQPVKALSAQKAAATDWGDDSSDDNLPGAGSSSRSKVITSRASGSSSWTTVKLSRMMLKPPTAPPRRHR